MTNARRVSSPPSGPCQRKVEASHGQRNGSALARADTATVIEVGDFIKARRTTCCGIVLRTGELTAGRMPIPGYWVVLASGRKDFIDAASAELIHKSEAWWQRAAQEVAQQDGPADGATAAPRLPANRDRFIGHQVEDGRLVYAAYYRGFLVGLFPCYLTAEAAIERIAHEEAAADEAQIARFEAEHWLRAA